jgi:hypothetical protein
MIDREFRKNLRLLNGRHETIRTKFEVATVGLVEHVILETHGPQCPATGYREITKCGGAPVAIRQSSLVTGTCSRSPRSPCQRGRSQRLPSRRLGTL